MKITARCIRHGGWWAVEVPEVDGAYTQARRLDQVPAMVADAVALLTEVDAADVEVDVQPVIDDALRARIDTAERLRREAAETRSAASSEIRAAAAALADQGLPLRDVGALLGVSHQRAHQLVHS